MLKGAIFDTSGKYRYKLWRIWDNNKPAVVFVGLNPSYADCKSDDRTSHKLVKISRNLGYGGFHLVNLFAYVSRDPKELRIVSDPIGKQNDIFLKEVVENFSEVVLIWGNNGALLNRNKDVLNLFCDKLPYCIARTKLGHPIHPLYQRDDCKLISFF